MLRELFILRYSPFSFEQFLLISVLHIFIANALYLKFSACVAQIKHSLRYIFLAGGDDFFQLSGNGSCYHLSSSMKNYDQAMADCQSKGANLTCPETVAELTDIRNFLRTSKSTLMTTDSTTESLLYHYGYVLPQ